MISLGQEYNRLMEEEELIDSKIEFLRQDQELRSNYFFKKLIERRIKKLLDDKKRIQERMMVIEYYS